jgi:hypothetical protein
MELSMTGLVRREGGGRGEERDPLGEDEVDSGSVIEKDSVGEERVFGLGDEGSVSHSDRSHGEIFLEESWIAEESCKEEGLRLRLRLTGGGGGGVGDLREEQRGGIVRMRFNETIEEGQRRKRQRGHGVLRGAYGRERGRGRGGGRWRRG